MDNDYEKEPTTTIKLTKKTVKKLNRLKILPEETMESVVTRLISKQKSANEVQE